MKLLLLTQMHQRPHIARLFCMAAVDFKRYTEQHYPDIEVHIRSLVSDDASQHLCAEFGIGITRTPAYPLGYKMNRGLNAILDYEFDYLLKIDDDTVFPEYLIEYYLPYIRKGVHYCGVQSIYMVNSATGQAMHWRYQYNTAKLFGPGKLISRQALERTGLKLTVRALQPIQHHGINLGENALACIPSYQAKYLHAMGYAEIISTTIFRLYNDEQTKSLDYVSEMNFLFNGYEPVEVVTDEPIFTDIKSDVNIWGYDTCSQHGQSVPFDQATSFFTSQQLAYLLTLKSK